MANTLDAVMPKILAQALNTVRETAVITQVVNGDYSPEPSEKGNKIVIPLPARMTAQDVEPGAYSQSTPDLINDSAEIVLDSWKESAFYLTDAEIAGVMSGYQNMQIAEAAKAIVNAMASSLYRKASQHVYNAVGTAGTTPFATDASVAKEARRLLNANMAPLTDRRMVLDVDAEANAHDLAKFQQADLGETVINGMVDRRYGFDIYMDQLITESPVGVHTGAPAVAYVGGAATTSTRVDNARTIYTTRIDGFTGTPAIKAGDSFTVAGDSQQYVVTQDAAVASGAATVQFLPMPAVVWADNALVTFGAASTNSLAFHRDAIALAVRPLVSSEFELQLGGRALTMADPVTGIPLRLEVRREHKRVRYSLDALWGCAVPRPAWAVKIRG